MDHYMDAGEAPALVIPKHRREMPHWVQNPDNLTNQARCSSFGNARCERFACPRHDPNLYAEQSARHATDSLWPVQIDG